ncbi:MAG: peptidoglycan-binding domain-containing protein [Oscillospiraceae bacterium]
MQYVPQNGFFGAETKDAVMAFQEGFNLQVTGIVDKATWDAIYGYYISA